MESGTVQSDKGVGLGVLFAVLTLVGALVMLAAPGQLATAWGFAAAMVAASLAVVAVHAFA